MTQRVYCIFEGAGARGLGHIGAYRSISKQPLDIKGFAGTSAGAIVAALACAGYSAEDLFSEKTKKTVLDLLDLASTNADAEVVVRPASTPANLFGKSQWWKIRLIRFLLDRPWIFWFLAISTGGIVLPGMFLFPQQALVLLAVDLAAGAIAAGMVARGIVNLDPVREGIDQLLRLKLHGKRLGNPVTFADLAAAGRPPLKVVAANISRQETTVFSVETTPDVPVADAVCASIAIPGVFRPRKVGDSWYMDGGLVSNLPAWTFDDERSIDRDALTAAIEIGVSDDRPGDAVDWTLGSAFRTMLFGSGILNKRGVDRLTPELLIVNIGLLDFDVGFEHAAKIIREAEEYCDINLIARMIELPFLINDACSKVSLRCHDILSAAFEAAGLAGIEFRTRLAVAVPVSPRYKNLRLEFSSGYDDLSDERISLPIDRSFIGRAWNENDTLYISKSDAVTWGESLAEPEDRWLRKLIWKDMAWVLCVPIEIDRETKVVVTLDADRELEFDEQALQELLDGMERIILDEFQLLDSGRDLLHAR
ncbi:patatin-like phospholipase family protein [Ensifer adhaerens]|uniref:Patatin-like phospholipase family protein n=1 Tax=Ensifer adhaerens TaxID=106592 RepID=A0A9Q8YFT8_ENSAD|nr:patatin-like phospholipase family protein [Ensifer adhaerens]USJ28500.1 patatin-like phospholipase family protein [Ensifer adhaerens]